ncbi:MAG: hypothetical protein CL850_00020 [Crocinitomicaceae bacterium]|nr:hypothetical protein [Crocinitomicaceae bacterium]|tara:strand:+ start:632 stop:985 length:354 start_codon:yes stop_codon:yes gene_type:complete
MPNKIWETSRARSATSLIASVIAGLGGAIIHIPLDWDYNFFLFTNQKNFFIERSNRHERSVFSEFLFYYQDRQLLKIISALSTINKNSWNYICLIISKHLQESKDYTNSLDSMFDAS